MLSENVAENNFFVEELLSVNKLVPTLIVDEEAVVIFSFKELVVANDPVVLTWLVDEGLGVVLRVVDLNVVDMVVVEIIGVVASSTKEFEYIRVYYRV